MDIKTLYRMAKSAAVNAEKAVVSQGDDVQTCSGYAAYIHEYNRLVPFVIQECGDEAAQLFPLFNVDKIPNWADSTRIQWRIFMDHAIVSLNRLAAYLEAHAGVAEREYSEVMDLLGAKLRSAMRKAPDLEKEVSDQMEVLFTARDFEFVREGASIPYSSKCFIPDFTFPGLDLIVETKLCKSGNQEKTLIDEINADIPAYKTKHSRILFVVYDLGHIRDEDRFKSDIESLPGVNVLVVKH